MKKDILKKLKEKVTFSNIFLIYMIIALVIFFFDLCDYDNLFFTMEIHFLEGISILNGILIPIAVLYLGHDLQERETSRRTVLRLENLFGKFVILNQYAITLFSKVEERPRDPGELKAFFIDQHREYKKFYNSLLSEYGKCLLYLNDPPKKEALDIIDSYFKDLRKTIFYWKEYKKNDNYYSDSENPAFPEYNKERDRFLKYKWEEKILEIFTQIKESL